MNASQSVNWFLKTISTMPDLSKFKYYPKPVATMTKAIASGVFGKSILLPIGQGTVNGKLIGKRTKENPLSEEIN